MSRVTALLTSDHSRVTAARARARADRTADVSHVGGGRALGRREPARDRAVPVALGEHDERTRVRRVGLDGRDAPLAARAHPARADADAGASRAACSALHYATIRLQNVARRRVGFHASVRARVWCRRSRASNGSARGLRLNRGVALFCRTSSRALARTDGTGRDGTGRDGRAAHEARARLRLVDDVCERALRDRGGGGRHGAPGEARLYDGRDRALALQLDVRSEVPALHRITLHDRSS